MSDWVVVCPTRARADVIGQMTYRFFPSIIYAVSQEDKPVYMETAGIPEDQLMVVESRGITNVMAEIMEKRNEHTVVRVDDDLLDVTVAVGQRYRRYTEEEDLFALIEQGMDVSRDLGLSLFHWGFVRNPMYYSPYEPFTFMNGIAAQIYGINGRSLQYDRSLFVHEDFDLTMQAYLLDRVAWYDHRVIWKFTNPNEGRGGLQGQRTAEREKRSGDRIQEKWGRYLKRRPMNDGWNFAFTRKNPIVSVK